MDNESLVLKNLNERQKEAVSHFKGPILIIAGAGSGKTKVLTHRVARLIEKGVGPENILAVTFTNKAAGEMKERIIKLLKGGVSGLPFVSTFHSLAVNILKESGRAIDIPRNFSILDEEDSLSILKEAIKELKLDPKQYQPSRIKAIISQKKGELAGPEAFSGAGIFGKTLTQIWDLYDKKLAGQKALDFDDLIQKTVVLLQEKKEVLESYQKKWQFINVDEYQDTNYAQYTLVNLLARQHKNICVVGDADQCIYSWRGADFRNILNFERDYPEAKIVTLEENYRSTQKILDAANAVIVKNKLRQPKKLFTKKAGGEDVRFFMTLNEKEEAEHVGREIENLIAEGIKPSDIAVLYRTNFQSRILEEEFLKRSTPYQVIGIKFYERKEVKDVLAYLRFALNPDDLLSLKRVVNLPTSNIGKSLFLKYLSKKELNQKEAEKIKIFEKTIKDITDAVKKQKASFAIEFLLGHSGYLNMLNEKTDESETRLLNVRELATVAVKFDQLDPPLGVEKLLEEAALMSEQNNLKNKEGGVKLMTVHAAKGLEFNYVFVAGLEDGLFPHVSPKDDSRQEEERRLFYVALTRAKEKLYLSCAITRTIFGSQQINRPSRFLLDIPPELLKSADNTIQL